ncbi:F420-dependent glucose-6-phosphate dehydrogenase [Streptomyces hirsutus]
MQLGINLGYWGAGMDADNLAVAQEADRLGYAVCWAAEAYGSDAATVLTWVAAQTERIDVGSAIFQIPARQPAMTAMTAATLDSLSGGRFRLGLGVSGPQVSEGWYGVKFDKPLARTREYVEIIRKAMTRERLTHDGEHWTLPLPGGPGKPIKLTVHPQREHIPLYIAAIGPKNLEQTGEIADGALLIFPSADHLEDTAVTYLRAGREKAGKTLDGFDICPTVPLAVGDDKDVTALADTFRPYTALYVGGMGSREQNFYNQARRAHGLRAGGRRDPGQVPVRRQAGRRRGRTARPDRLHDAPRLRGPHRGRDEGLRGGRGHHPHPRPGRFHPRRAARVAARRHRGPGTRRSRIGPSAGPPARSSTAVAGARGSSPPRPSPTTTPGGSRGYAPVPPRPSSVRRSCRPSLLPCAPPRI